MGKQQSELDKLYSGVSSQFDIGDIETFKSKMKTPEDRKRFYDAVSENGFDLGDYSEYESRLGKTQEVSPQGSVGTSPESVEPTQSTSQQGLPQTGLSGTPNGDLLSQSLGQVNNEGLLPVEGQPEQPRGVSADTARQDYVKLLRSFNGEAPLSDEDYSAALKSYGGFIEQSGGLPQVPIKDTWRENYPGSWNYDIYGYEVFEPTQEAIDWAGGWDKMAERFREYHPNTILQRQGTSQEGVADGATESVNEDIARPAFNPVDLAEQKRLMSTPFEQWSDDDKMDMALSQMMATNALNGFITEDERQNRRIIDEATRDRENAGGVVNTLLSGVSSAVRGFGSGATRLGADALGIPEFLNDAIATAIGTPTFKEAYGETFIEDIQRYMRGAISRDELYNSVRFSNNGIIDSFERGNIEDGVNKLVSATTTSLPIMLSLSSGNAAGLVSTLSMGAGQYNNLQETNPNMDNSMKMLNATLNMYAEMIPEKIGADVVFKPFYELYKKGGREVSEQALSKFLRQFSSQFGILTPTAVEGLTEGTTAVMQNVIAKYSGEDPDRKINEGVADAVLTGAFSGGAISSPAVIGNSISNRANRTEAERLAQENADIEVALNDRTTPPEIRQSLTEKYLRNTQQVNGYIEEEINRKGSLSESQKVLVNELEGRKQRLDRLLENESVPESVRESSQADIDVINNEIETILESNENTEASTETVVEDTTVSPETEVALPQNTATIESAFEAPGVFYREGERGNVRLDGQTVVFETQDTIYELGNVDEISQSDISKFGIESESPLDISVDTDYSVTIDGSKYVNQNSDPMAAINYSPEGDVVSINMETEDGSKRTIRGQRAQEVAYQYTLRNFEENATEQQIDSAIEQTNEAVTVNESTAEAVTPTEVENTEQPAKPRVQVEQITPVSETASENAPQEVVSETPVSNTETAPIDTTTVVETTDTVTQPEANVIDVEQTSETLRAGQEIETNRINRENEIADVERRRREEISSVESNTQPVSQNQEVDVSKHKKGNNYNVSATTNGLNTVEGGLKDVEPDLRYSPGLRGMGFRGEIVQVDGITDPDVKHYVYKVIEKNGKRYLTAGMAGADVAGREGFAGITIEIDNNIDESRFDDIFKIPYPAETYAKLTPEIAKKFGDDVLRVISKTETSTPVDNTQSINEINSRYDSEISDINNRYDEQLREIESRQQQLETQTNVNEETTIPTETTIQENVTETVPTEAVQESENSPAEQAEQTVTPEQTRPTETTSNFGKNENSAQIREKYGFGERVKVDTVGFDEMTEQARKDIRSGRTHIPTLRDKVWQGQALSDTEVVAMVEYLNQQEDAVAERTQYLTEESLAPAAFKEGVEMRDQAMDEILRTLEALERTGTITGRALAARKALIVRDISLPSMLSAKRQAVGNRELTSEEKTEVNRKFREIEKSQKRLEKRNAEIISELSDARAEIALLQEKYKAELAYRKNRDKAGSKKEYISDIQKRRQEAKDKLSEAINRITSVGFANLPDQNAKNDLSFMEALGELTATYLEEGLARLGRVNYDSIINRITSDVRAINPNITKEQVVQLIDGLDTDQRQSLYDLGKEINILKEQLKDKNLSAQKDAIRNRIKDVQKKIDNKDYKKAPARLEKYDSELQRLKRDLDQKQYEFKLDLERDRLRQRTKGAKLWDVLIETQALPRALMATADLSAAFRQGIFAFAGHPITGMDAFLKMHKFAFSEQYYRDYFDAVAETEVYQLAEMSGLSLVDIGPNVHATLREEQFMSKLVNKIPAFGKLAQFSERGFSGFLNKMRLDLFNIAADTLIKEGKNPVDNLNDFKAIATYINATTGRGPGPKGWDMFMSKLSVGFFAPRLMTSRMWLLTGGPLFSGSDQVRKMYARDLMSFIAFGVITTGLASFAGADVSFDDDDEEFNWDNMVNEVTSTDFMNIRVGDRRYDIWGGFGQYVKFFARMIFGQKVSSSGRVSNINPYDEDYVKGQYAETYGTLIQRFGRSKLSPTAAYVIGALNGDNYMGEPFSFTKEAANMSMPLIWQDTFEAWTEYNEGPMSLVSTFAPAFYGAGVQTWKSNSFLQSGVDDQILELLQKKRVNTNFKTIDDIEIVDPVSGAKRNPTEEEYKQYMDNWSDYVKEDLKQNRKKYEKMTQNDFDKAFNTLKSQATVFTKKRMTGVSNEDTQVKIEGATVKLNPSQISKRVRIMNEYKRDNSEIYNSYIDEYMNRGLSRKSAEIQADKRFDSDARSYSRTQLMSEGDIQYSESDD